MSELEFDKPFNACLSVCLLVSFCRVYTIVMYVSAQCYSEFIVSIYNKAR